MDGDKRKIIKAPSINERSIDIQMVIKETIYILMNWLLFWCSYLYFFISISIYASISNSNLQNGEEDFY